MFYKIGAMIFVAVAVSGLGIYFAMPSEEPEYKCGTSAKSAQLPISEGSGCCMKSAAVPTCCSMPATQCTTAEKPEALGACIGGSFAVTAKPSFTCCDD
jgi:hypothetical protein